MALVLDVLAVVYLVFAVLTIGAVAAQHEREENPPLHRFFQGVAFLVGTGLALAELLT
jgi:hypothetical protein